MSGLLSTPGILRVSSLSPSSPSRYLKMLLNWYQGLSLASFFVPGSALLRFSCSQLVTERLDPLVNPGVVGSPHLHQIIGGNTFNATMDPKTLSIPDAATCTTCTFAEDFSNYWTAVLFFRARNGTYKRVPQKGNVFFEESNGGMTVYYIPSYQNTKVTAFKPYLPSKLDDANRRNLDMPKKPCPAGIMANLRFPTCWDGVNLDSADHSSHVSYPQGGTFENGAPCPTTHPVKIPQLFYEIVWDTTAFNNPKDWPEDGSQPFVWSYGDATGFGNHGDYVFGWKGDALQKAMDTNCNGDKCNGLSYQAIKNGNACTKKPSVNEELSGCT
ncbi:hypothetical protein RRF57_001696 [Xylaria bambusicola]|uniref:DUF1996 domain-containing protein n=1 Tax=Xylaria bambusicola TaxID=326684 RepID=A0AAN7U5A5_9PEZI